MRRILCGLICLLGTLGCEHGGSGERVGILWRGPMAVGILGMSGKLNAGGLWDGGGTFVVRHNETLCWLGLVAWPCLLA